MRRTCEAGIESLRMYLEMEIAKLTKPVLELTMGQFVGEFNGDPLLFFEKQRAMQVDADAIIGARRAVRRRNGCPLTSRGAEHIASVVLNPPRATLVGATQKQQQRARVLRYDGCDALAAPKLDARDRHAGPDAAPVGARQKVS